MQGFQHSYMSKSSLVLTNLFVIVTFQSLVQAIPKLNRSKNPFLTHILSDKSLINGALVATLLVEVPIGGEVSAKQ